MFKKLQNLLFEEEEEEIVVQTSDKEEKVEVQTDTIPVPQPQPVEEPVVEAVQEEVQTVVEEVAPEVPEAPTPVVAEPAPVEEVKAPAMQRIDVTQPIPTTEAPNRPASNNVSFDTSATVGHTSSLGITADETVRPVEERRTTRPSRREESAPYETSYQFQPVISPIFGVDEKDLDALKSTTSKITAYDRARAQENVTPIISPMYGKDQEDIPSSIKDTVEKSNQQETLRATVDKVSAEDEIPEFSLDDILQTRENDFLDEFAYEPPVSEGTDSLFPDLNLWSEELEDVEDQTTVIERSEE